ncbi:FkbM family methyltransferase [Rubritepida flocculans]|uniref:FkbM family methyltransferase n=1 Tax=Rubritepida flocculans TaxID=182403 RepID=UPI00040C37EC|nr:FkbM family methyltransferase [Rubritepida flocculans]
MEELDFHRALHRPGTLLDIGAHDGLLTHPFAALPGSRVIAFEPLPAAMARLRASFGAAPPPHVTLREEALGAAEGEAVLTLPVLEGVPAEQWASLAKDYAGHAGLGRQAHRVRVIALDSLALQDVTAIKLDVEGAEEEAIAGAAATLARCRPVLSVEIEERHRPGSTRRVPAQLAALGYAGWFWLGGRLQPFAAFDAATMQAASPDPSVFAASDPYVFTFFFLPREAEAAMLARLAAAGFPAG